MIECNVYPNGKKGDVTFSFDDGHENDAKLISLFNRDDSIFRFKIISQR